MLKYYTKKEKARNLAIDWQLNFTNNDRSWGYCITWAARWERIGRKYGLIREFKENGLI
jgi:hypothetical protein